MKQVEVQVRAEHVEAVVRLGDELGGFAPSHHEILIQGEEGWRQVKVNLPNDRIGRFVAEVEDEVGEAEFILPTSGTLPVRSPVTDIRDRVRDVSRRSTLELVLDVLQSLGTWKGMLLYAVVSGLVAAYGVIFNISFLLTAAMLIAPLGAPAMVCVVGITVGDLWMLRRGGLRFVVALVVLASAAALLGLAYGLEGATPMMETLTDLSVWSALLGVAGGAAGAQALIQAERDSLVTATATGFLVAVSLSPPSAVLGLAIPLGRWDYVALMVFLITTTLAGIFVGGWLSLHLLGVGPGRFSAGRGRGRARWILSATVVVALGGLVLWQGRQGPSYKKADMVRHAAQLASDAVDAVPGYRVLTADAEFTPGDAEWHDGEGLLLTLVVKQTAESATDLTVEAAPEALRGVVRRRVAGALSGVRPFVAVTVIPR